MPASILVEHLTGMPPEAAAVSEVRFRADDFNERNHLAPIVRPHPVSSIVTASLYPGSGISTPITPTPYFEIGQRVMVGEGDSAEVTSLLSCTPSTLVFSELRRTHPIGTRVRAVAPSRSKVFQVRLAEADSRTVTNLRLARSGDLPDGLFDMWRLLTEYAEASSIPIEGSPVPPVARASQIAVGPWQAPAVLALVEIQALFAGNPASFPEVRYLFLWDEA